MSRPNIRQVRNSILNIECRLDGGSATMKENCGVVLYLSRRK